MLKYQTKFSMETEINNKTIKFRPWTTLDEKMYLLATEADENPTEDQLYDILIKPCLENPDIDLNNDEKILMIIEIRKKSIGNTFNLKYQCVNCIKVNDMEVEIDKVLKYIPDTFEDIVVEDDGQNIIFKINDNNVSKLNYKVKEQDIELEKSFTEFLIHIDTIEYKGSLEDSFTFEELKSFVESLPSSVFDDAFDKFRKMKGSIKFNVDTYCQMCNAKNHINFDSIPNFLWV